MENDFNDSSQGDCQRSEEVLRSLNPRWPREVEWFQWRAKLCLTGSRAI
jgi:hypothetical protein